jgi:hypothetical protein
MKGKHLMRRGCVRENAAEFMACGKEICRALTRRSYGRTIMSDILNKTIVLVLNRNWQAINIRTPQEAFCMMAISVATALEIEGENHIRPVTWDEWITLPIRDGDNLVRTARGPTQGSSCVATLG